MNSEQEFLEESAARLGLTLDELTKQSNEFWGIDDEHNGTTEATV